MTKGIAESNPLNIPDARKNIKNTLSTMSIHPNIWSALSTVVLLYGDDDDDEPGLVISYLFAVATTTTPSSPVVKMAYLTTIWTEHYILY
jgi:hypothetical protein